MGTNPFDDDEDSNAAFENEAQHHEENNSNPFGKMPSPTQPYRQKVQPYGSSIGSEKKLNLRANAESKEDPIWTARNVEWPIPLELASSTVKQLYRTSQQLLTSGNLEPSFVESTINNSINNDLLPDDGHQPNASGYTTSIAGLMSRVLNNSNSSSNAASNQSPHVQLSGHADLKSSRGYRLLPPDVRCVAASNGWIVSLTECFLQTAEESTHTTTGSPLVGNIPIPSENKGMETEKNLRILSRWNVYRGAMSAGSGIVKQSTSGKGMVGDKGEMLFPLPQSLTDTTHTNSNGSIAGLFVDPTGCHTFISAYNGEAYYLHSSFKRVQKLPGFGPGREKTDSSITMQSLKSGAARKVDMGIGLKPNTYVTAIAWDKERGTEGSTKRILLGTNIGEIYEYSLSASDGDDLLSSTDKNASTQSYSGEEDLKQPLLLHVLNPLPSQPPNHAHFTPSPPCQVSGLHFERNQGTIVVLAVTSGSRQLTWLYSFRYQVSNVSNPNAVKNANLSFQTVFSSISSSINTQSQSFTQMSCKEIQGSIDFADLKVCQDAFAIRGETGIYYGIIDRAGSITPKLSTINSNPTASQFESGMLPHLPSIPSPQSQHENQSPPINTPVSIALTPHHFITLSYDGSVTFINRVSCKPIQRERVDWNSNNLISNRYGSSSSFGKHHIMDLMMDVRRPDQVWLRQGQILIHINSSQEDRDVWKYTLEKSLEGLLPVEKTQKRNSHPKSMHSPILSSQSILTSTEEKLEDAQFEIAKSQCSNATQKSVVGLVRAEFHLARGRTDIAAKHFAQAPSKVAPFSSTALRLLLPVLDFGNFGRNGSNVIDKKSHGALIIYLMDKFRVAAGKRDSVQCTMLGAWLVELYLHEKEREKSVYNEKSSSRATYKAGLFNGSNKGGVSNFSPSHSSSMTSSLKEVKVPSLGSFLANNFRYLDAQTTIRILASHDVKAVECSDYAAASGNIKTAVNAALSGDLGKTGAMDALRVLNDSPIEIAEPYYYKHASTLLSRAPMQSARSFLARYPHGLSPTALLPAFMHYERRRGEMRELAAKMELEHGPLVVGNRNDPLMRNSSGMNTNNFNPSKLSEANFQIQGSVSTDASGVEISIDKGSYKHNTYNAGFIDDEKAAVKYLEGVIKLGCQSSAIYNYLISLYAAMDDEGPLFRFLSANVPTGPAGYSKDFVHNLNTKAMDGKKKLDMSSSPLDMAYALRLVLKTGRHFRSAVKLYMGFGLRQQAVELALKVDPSLARELARESVEIIERKKLWLMIARNAASNEHGKNKDVVAKVVSVIKDCGPDVLSIEDVLPFLPDFAQIDQFKDEICLALTSYSSKIDKYLKEMNECNQTCDALREEISRLRSHDMGLLPSARCAFTHKLVINEDEPFYVFPSGFVALEGPLRAEVTKYLNADQRNRLEIVEKELNRIEEDGKKKIFSANDRLRRNELQLEKDGLIAAECPFTGSIMVESIDKDFASCLEEDQRYEF